MVILPANKVKESKRLATRSITSAQWRLVLSKLHGAAHENLLYNKCLHKLIFSTSRFTTPCVTRSITSAQWRLVLSKLHGAAHENLLYNKCLHKPIFSTSRFTTHMYSEGRSLTLLKPRNKFSVEKIVKVK